MSWIRSHPFRSIIVAVLAIILVTSLVERDWAWAAITAAVLALNIARLVTLRADAAPGKQSSPPA